MKVTSALICDDIRTELNRKDILIGVYPGAITVAQLPFTIPLAVWIELSPDSLGTHSVGVRLSYDGGEVLKVDVNLDIYALGAIALPVSGIALSSDKLGDIVVEFSEDRTTWAEIKRKRIVQGPVPSVLSPASPRA